ncbi:hypothetical protein BN975_03272 [Mycolicibacterium farcinogenes]|uniref:Lipoprotein n=1 Tax=Mycolicibacterium senegalense TaxID=1796 RepID=A0A378W760_9MYCO|nr:hypothetical protein BN975_03272 [Mycolicibacterium farcinogenes]SUA28905.1 Uncharacterised protein [Mycolicibacterium senegalense]
MIRAVIVGIAVLTIAGCGSESEPAATSSSAADASSAAPVSAEQQIRDLVAKEKTALAKFDFNSLAELTCLQYRDAVRNQADTLFPPLSAAGAPGELAGAPVDLLRSGFKRQHPTASDATINQLVDALIRSDEPAYKAANLEILRQTSKATIDKVENIKITGDKATADLTTTWMIGENPPATATQPNAYAKEDGHWLDCQSPTPQ